MSMSVTGAQPGLVQPSGAPWGGGGGGGGGIGGWGLISVIRNHWGSVGLSAQCMYTHILVHIKKYYFIHFRSLFLKLSKAFNVSLNSENI